MQVSFYHLERGTVETALPRLLEKALGAGHKIAVFLNDAERMKAVDTALWTYDPASFLPHGCEGQTHSDLQPIYLTTSQDVPNKADILTVLDAALPDDLDGFARCLYMFEAERPGAMEQARAHWTQLKDAGNEVTYWQQNERGGWEKKA